MDSTQMLRALDMKGTGKTINNMEKVQRLGMKDQDMRVCMQMERKKGLENTNGQMGQFMKESGLITELTERVFIYGKMEGSIMENGQITIWKVLVFISGQMVDAMKDNIKMIRSVVSVSIIGLMAVSMKAGGTRANSTVQVHTLTPQKEK